MAKFPWGHESETFDTKFYINWQTRGHVIGDSLTLNTPEEVNNILSTILYESNGR